MISETDLSKPCMSFFKLLNQGLIQRNKLAELFSSVATEVMFDLIQFTQLNGNKLSCEIIPNDPQTKICLLLPVVEFLPTLKQALQTWQQWQSENLTKYSPNLFPFIQQPALLQSQNLSDINKSIVSQINGSESIRALALKSKLNLVTVTKSLLPLINQGVISLSPVLVTKKSEPRNLTGDAPVRASPVKTPPKRDLLVACVDDSPVVCQAVEKIIESQGYRFLGIQDSLKALPLFLKNKPDFIFLDLVMPITNGYELCAQFRKTPSLKSVPVVILTGRDGLVDRMRAKIAGSNDFLSKPVQEDEVLNVLNKHLQISK
jgi:chemotaxis family two-component system response regulator PixG